MLVGGSKGGLIDIDTVNYTDNKYINSRTGGISSPTDNGGIWAYTDFIKVESGASYLFKQIDAPASTAGCAFYDEEQIRLLNAGINGNKFCESDTNIFVVPEGAAYMRHSFRIDEGYNVDWRHTVSITKVE